MRFAAGARVPRLPHARAPAEALRGGRAGDARRRGRWWRRCARTWSWRTSSRSRRRWRASSRACRWRRSSPTSTRARRRGWPPYSLGARLPRTARRARRLWGALDARGPTRRWSAAAASSTRPARRLGLPPLARVHGGISRELALVGDLPPARVPARASRCRRRTSSARCCGSRRPATSSCRRATSRWCWSRPRPRRTRRHRLLRATLRGPRRRCRCGCSRRGTAAPLGAPVDVPANARLVDWVSLLADDAALRRRRLPRRPRDARASAGLRLRRRRRARGGRHERERRAAGLGRASACGCPRRLCAPRRGGPGGRERALAEPRLRARVGARLRRLVGEPRPGRPRRAGWWRACARRRIPSDRRTSVRVMERGVARSPARGRPVDRGDRPGGRAPSVDGVVLGA